MAATSDEELEAYIRAGRVIARVKKEAVQIVKEGMRVIDICQKIEELTQADGCKPAFPCNVDINEVAAHYTSPPNDPTLIPPDSVVKIDLGAQYNGYIADTAVTVNYNDELQAMTQAVQEALDQALKIIRVGTRINEVGSLIERTIKEHGFKPISNLTGHGLAQYQIHTSPTIPNVNSPLSFGRFEAEHAYAIEPFATTRDGAGEIHEAFEGYIYRITKIKPPRDEGSRELLNSIRNQVQTLPFAQRWFTHSKAANAFNNLTQSHHIATYPVLIERRRKPVAQAEHSIFLHSGEALVLT